MPKITLVPLGKVVEISSETDFYSGIKSHGLHINSTCGGCASCAKCIITVLEGEENLNEIPYEEARLLGNVFHITKERLACQVKAHGPVTIDMSQHEQEKEKMNDQKSSIKRRTKQEVERIHEERREQKKQKPKKLGGGKKPKAFDYKEEN